jgi:hypothetical protein
MHGSAITTLKPQLKTGTTNPRAAFSQIEMNMLLVSVGSVA